MTCCMYTHREMADIRFVETDTNLQVVNAMLQAARTSLKASKHHQRITNPRIRTISTHLDDPELRPAETDTDTHLPVSTAPVFETIKRRRSVGQVTQEEPTRSQIERLLEAATYAPNHHVTEPWHFFVVSGAAREKLGEIMEESLRRKLPDTSNEKARLLLWKERNKPLRAPVVITVALRDARNQAGELQENIEAAAAAVQNMLLAAEEIGLATIWRTGDTTHDPMVKQWFGLEPDDPIVAFVYVGYPRSVRPMRTPTSFSAKTTWLS